MDCAAKIPGVPGVPATAAATCETNLTVTLSPSFSCVSEVVIKSWPLRLSVKAVLPEVFRLTVMVAPFAIGNLFFPCGTVFTFTVTESSAVGVPTTTPVTVISTRLAAPTVDCGLGVLLAAVGALVGQQLADLLRDSETYVPRTVDFLNGHVGTNIDAASVIGAINDPNGSVQQFIDRQQRRVFDLSVTALGFLVQSLSVLMFTFYLVADGPKLRRAICSRVRPERQRVVLDTWDLAIDKTGGYLYSRALLAGFSAVFHGIVFQLIGTPAPVAMAVWVGVTSEHRAAAFDACRFLIEELKARLPIWKKEHYAAGGATWIGEG